MRLTFRRGGLHLFRTLIAVMLASVVLVACRAEDDSTLEPAIEIHILAEGRYRIGSEFHDYPGDVRAMRACLARLAADSDKAPITGEPDARVLPTRRVAIDSEQETPFIAVQILLANLAHVDLWRIELVAADGEVFPIPLPHEEPPLDPSSCTGAYSEEHRDRTADITLLIASTEPRQLVYRIGPRTLSSLIECQAILETWNARCPLDRVEIDPREGVRFDEVMELMRAVRKADIPNIPIQFVGPSEW